jgi:hypothetical protein
VSWLWRAFLREVVDFEGSTRLVAVIRVLLALVAWSRFGYTLQLAQCEGDPVRLGLMLLFWPASTLLLVGLFTGPAAAITALCALALYHVVGRHQGVDALASHHVLVLAIGLALLALTPCGRSLSLDRMWALHRAQKEGAPAPAERGHLFGQRLLAVHVAVLYLGTAWEKTYPGFLDGSRLQQIYLSTYFGSDGPDPSWFVPLTLVSAWLVTACEWLLPFGLFVPRLQPLLIPAGMVMHGVMYHQIPVATFTTTMWALYLAFLDPDRFHRFTEQITDGETT